MNRHRPLALIIAALILTGCSTNAEPSVSTTSSVDASSSVTTSSSAEPDLASLGTTQTFSDGEVEVGVTAFEVQGVIPVEGAPSILAPGVSNTALDVRVCSSIPTTVQGMDRWALVDANGGRYEASTGVNPPKPEYPYTPVSIGAGECVRGWVVFETKDGVPVVAARYSTGDGLHVFRWRI